MPASATPPMSSRRTKRKIFFTTISHAPAGDSYLVFARLAAPAIGVQPARILEPSDRARLFEQRIEDALDLGALRNESHPLPHAHGLRSNLHQQLLAQAQIRLDVVHVVVGAQLRQLRGGIGGVLESAEMIHQADALRIEARPHPALRNLVDVLVGLLA